MIGIVLFGWAALLSPNDRIDFERQVAPILEQHCVRCHQSSRRGGELDLTRPTTVIAERGDGYVVVAGRPDESVLLAMVAGEEPEMPREGTPLTDQQVTVLRQWISEGAPWPPSRTLVDLQPAWWSLQRLDRPAVPRRQSDWARNPIDLFVLAQLDDRQLSPSPPADRRTLIRRLYFDLVGLPPPPEAIERFLHDAEPHAYERLVDRLLASPHYGERWGRHWLDVAHYGDTHGYDKDKLRPNAWPYRDYVIRSFNADKSYERFVSEQLAGDVLFGGSAEALTALGFIAAGPFDWVGQIEVREGTQEKKRVRNLDRDDMVASTMNTFVSLTAQCARCHDHKFDPISQQDYYSLQAIFAGVDRADRPVELDPVVARQRTSLTAQRRSLAESRDHLVARLHQQAGPRLAELDKLIAAAANPEQTESPEYGYHSQVELSADVEKWVQVDLGKSYPIDRIVYVGCHDRFNNIGAGFGFPARFRIDVSNDPAFGDNVTCVLDCTDRDVENPGVTPQAVRVGGTRARYIRVTATRLAPRKNDYIFALAELEVFDSSGGNVASAAGVTSLDSIEAPVRWRRTNLTDGIYYGLATVEDGAALRAEREQLLVRRGEPETRRQLASHDRQLAEVSAALTALPPPQPVFAAATHFSKSGHFTPTLGHPRDVYLLERGDVNQPAEPALPGTVSCVAGLDSRFSTSSEGEAPRRAALAQWIVDRRNPLTWRSLVNRLWGHHFGRGLVDTPNDFGRMGTPPTHPDLLDWLAVEFRDRGQSIKHMHRLMVTSATYRQSSATRPGHERTDGGNRFLWRANRRRLDAEAVRDSVLVLAGRLDDRLGGPGFRPFGFKDDHSPHYMYEAFDPDDPSAQRRSVYRFIVRSVPDPFMTTLDCADPSLNVARRNETITPLQALSMLNNPLMVRAAEHFAARLSALEADPPRRIRLAFRLALGRDADRHELADMTSLEQRHGLVSVCRLIMNTNEFVFVD